MNHLKEKKELAHVRNHRRWHEWVMGVITPRQFAILRMQSANDVAGKPPSQSLQSSAVFCDSAS